MRFDLFWGLALTTSSVVLVCSGIPYARWVVFGLRTFAFVFLYYVEIFGREGKVKAVDRFFVVVRLITGLAFTFLLWLLSHGPAK